MAASVESPPLPPPDEVPDEVKNKYFGGGILCSKFYITVVEHLTTMPLL